MKRLGILIVPAVAACATASSYDRWRELSDQPDFISWATCIEAGAQDWASYLYPQAAEQAGSRMSAYNTNDEAFRAILAQCAVHTAAPPWQALSPKRRERVSELGRWRFDTIVGAAWDAHNQSII
jgi:hypothetical protein